MSQLSYFTIQEKQKKHKSISPITSTRCQRSQVQIAPVLLPLQLLPPQGSAFPSPSAQITARRFACHGFTSGATMERPGVPPKKGWKQPEDMEFGWHFCISVGVFWPRMILYMMDISILKTEENHPEDWGKMKFWPWHPFWGTSGIFGWGRNLDPQKGDMESPNLKQCLVWLAKESWMRNKRGKRCETHIQIHLVYHTMHS